MFKIWKLYELYYSESKMANFMEYRALEVYDNFVLRAVIDSSLSLKHFKWIDPPFRKHRL